MNYQDYHRKTESMHFQACIPQSRWEFSVEHATHVYNQTPLSRHNWQTPYQLLYGERPSIDHLRVFGCGAYVFLPAEIRANKLAPKSEMMTYLGNAPRAGGFTFMRSPNNVLFYSTHCIFDESVFPKCATPAKRPFTRLHDAPPTHHYHRDTIPVDEEVAPRRKAITQKGRIPPRQEEVQQEASEDPAPEPVAPSPERRASPSPPPTGPRRSQRRGKVPEKPGNIYSHRHPVEILKDPTGRKGRRTVQGPVPKPAENIPGPSRQIPDAPRPTVGRESIALPPISPTESEEDIE